MSLVKEQNTWNMILQGGLCLFAPVAKTPVSAGSTAKSRTMPRMAYILPRFVYYVLAVWGRKPFASAYMAAYGNMSKAGDTPV